MMTPERLAQIEAEAHKIGARRTTAALALSGHVRDLIAEVRRLQAERAAVREAFVQPGTEPVTEDMGKLARIVVEQLSEEVARVERMDQESAAAAIERTGQAIIAQKWTSTAAFQERALKAEAEIARLNVMLDASAQEVGRLKQDLEDARRMYREDMGRDDEPPDPVDEGVDFDEDPEVFDQPEE